MAVVIGRIMPPVDATTDAELAAAQEAGRIRRQSSLREAQCGSLTLARTPGQVPIDPHSQGGLR
jgi:hypothetical protein